MLANYNEVNKSFAEKVRQLDVKMHNLKQTTLYCSIQNTIEKCKKKTGDINEAEDVAWEDRRFALKQFIQKNEDALNDKLFDTMSDKKFGMTSDDEEVLSDD